MDVNTNRLNKVRYTLYAPRYDWAAQILNRSREKSIHLLEIKQAEKVLIVGAGTGLDLDYLPQGCEITATDITPTMVRRIENRNKKTQHQLTAMIMDGQQLSFQNEYFDVVILHLILAVIPNPELCLQEAVRVLKPNGRIAVYDKFVTKNQQPSRLRKMLNIFTNFFFSNITRSIELIVSTTDLKIIADQPANLGGMFRIIQLKK